MNQDELNQLAGKALRSGLDASESARLEGWFRENEAHQAQWADEQALNRLLRDLPVAPLSSNFTSRVLREITSGAATPARSRWLDRFAFWKRAWLRSLAAAATLGLVAVWVSREQSSLRQAEMQESVQLVSGVATTLRVEAAPDRVTTASFEAPSVELLEDFDSIRRLGATSAEPDLTLLAVLQ